MYIYGTYIILSTYYIYIIYIYIRYIYLTNSVPYKRPCTPVYPCLRFEMLISV